MGRANRSSSAREYRARAQSSGYGRLDTLIALDDLHPRQLGWAMEAAVHSAVEKVPGLIGRTRPFFLGARGRIIEVMSKAMVVAHSRAERGRLYNDKSLQPRKFNSLWICNLIFAVTAGSGIWVGDNEAGWSCSDGEANRNGFTHCIEVRHDAVSTIERGRRGPGPRAYTSGVVSSTGVLTSTGA